MPTAYAEWSEPAAASRAARLPTADQSRCSPPLANSLRKRSRSRLAIGSGRCEPGRFEPLVGDQGSVGLVHRGREQCRGQDLQVLVLVDTTLVHQRHRLAERLDHGADQEVAAQLDQVGGFGRLGHHEGALTDRVEQGLRHADGSRCTGGDDKELRGRGGIGATEDRCGDEQLIRVGVGLGKPSRQPDARAEATIPPLPSVTAATASSSASIETTTSPAHAWATVPAASPP